MNFISEQVWPPSLHKQSLLRHIVKPRTELRKILLVCGVLSSLLYVAMNVIVPMRFVGYSWLSQTVSELSAIGAPTRPLWAWLAAVYGLLLIAFGWGVCVSAGRDRPLRVIGSMLIAQGVIGFFWPPMHQREVLAAGGGTITDTMHIAFTMVWALLAMLAIGFGVASFGMRFRLYSIATILVLIVFGVWTGLDSPRMEANLPTPWIGLVERVNIGAFILWVVVLSILLLRTALKDGKFGYRDSSSHRVESFIDSSMLLISFR
jgi:hypothetical protein